MKNPIILDTSKIARYLWNGQRDRFWYRETRAHIEAVLPNEDPVLIIDLLAATSPNTSLKANVSQMFKALYLLKNDLPFKPGFMPNIRAQLEYIRAGKRLGGRKIENFAQAMKGDPNAVVVDVWIVRAFGLESKYVHNKSKRNMQRAPTNREYTAIETYIKAEAKATGMQPREFQSMLWGGIRTEATGSANTTRYDEILRGRIKYDLFSSDKYDSGGYNVIASPEAANIATGTISPVLLK